MTSGLSGSPAETVCRTRARSKAREVELHERAEERRRRAERRHAGALEHAQAQLGVELAALIPEEHRRAHAPLAEELAPRRLGPARVRERPVQVGRRQVLPEARRDLVARAHRGVRVQHHLRRRHGAGREVQEQRVVGPRRRGPSARRRSPSRAARRSARSRPRPARRRRSRSAATGTGRAPRASFAAASSSTTAIVAPARSIRCAMSRARAERRRGHRDDAEAEHAEQQLVPLGDAREHHERALAGRGAERLERVRDLPRGGRELAERDLAAVLAARVERDQRELARVLRGPVSTTSRVNS